MMPRGSGDHQVMTDDGAERTIHTPVDEHSQRLILEPLRARWLIAADRIRRLRHRLGLEPLRFRIGGANGPGQHNR